MQITLANVHWLVLLPLKGYSVIIIHQWLTLMSNVTDWWGTLVLYSPFFCLSSHPSLWTQCGPTRSSWTYFHRPNWSQVQAATNGTRKTTIIIILKKQLSQYFSVYYGHKDAAILQFWPVSISLSLFWCYGK